MLIHVCNDDNIKWGCCYVMFAFQLDRMIKYDFHFFFSRIKRDKDFSICIIIMNSVLTPDDADRAGWLMSARFIKPVII